MAFKLDIGSGLAIGILLFLCSMPAITLSARTIVGGDQHWHFGFNYTDWARKTAPFFLNDTLVFMYDPPNSTTFPHSVYLLPNLQSFQTCNLKRAKLMASVVQGAGQGFEVALMKRKPYYFACGERGGLHCNTGLMKFSVRAVRSSCRG